MAVFSGSGHYFLIGLLAVMAGSCTTELDVPRESAVPETFHATIDDNTGHEATRGSGFRKGKMISSPSASRCLTGPKG